MATMTRSCRFLVRIGFAGEFFATRAEPELAERLMTRMRVLVQTPRGVELGEVFSKIEPSEPPEESASATTLRILRTLTAEDELLVARLHRFKTAAVRRCQQLLAELGSSAVLLDVDQLFDGNTLVLHFLGPVDAFGREVTERVVAEYESQVQSIRLSELMTHGCGPDCGSIGGGCGSAEGDSGEDGSESRPGGGCASCRLAGSCAK